IAKSTSDNLQACNSTLTELGSLADGVEASAANLQQADKRIEGLLALSETLIEYIAESGIETQDTPIIRLVVDAAQRISAEVETAVSRGEITTGRLFDERYREIPGTNPKQFLTDYVKFTDRVLPEIQDPIRQMDPR